MGNGRRIQRSHPRSAPKAHNCLSRVLGQNCLDKVKGESQVPCSRAPFRSPVSNNGHILQIFWLLVARFFLSYILT